MIIVKDKKIIGIDKSFLKEINTTLDELSNIISTIELNINSLTNEPIEIKNTSFNVKKIEILSIEDIEIFELTKQSLTSELEEIKPEIEIPSIKPIKEEIPKIEPSFEEIPILKPEEELKKELETITPEITAPEIKEEVLKTEIEQIQPIAPELSEEKEFIQEVAPKTEFAEELKPLEKSFEEKNKEEALEVEVSKEKPGAEPIDLSESKEEQIKLIFEDDLAEVNKILNLPKKEAKDLINKEVKQAAQELGIDEIMTKELLNELYEQIENEKENFKKALENKDYDALHKIAHKLKGAALNLRLSKLAYILKTIDEKSKEHAPIGTLKELVNKFYEFFEKIREKTVVIPEYLKETILQTIKNYLETQDEKKFQKDKKYIEKILNTKIESIQDLENLVKENR